MELRNGRALRYQGQASDLTKYIHSLGFAFAATGDHPDVWRLSGDQAVLVLQSWKGTLGCCGGSDLPGAISIQWPFFGGRAHGKLFFDAFSTSTGRKLITVDAKFSGILPEDAFKNSGWATERYFFVPLDDRMTRCLVCEFGK